MPLYLVSTDYCSPCNATRMVKGQAVKQARLSFSTFSFCNSFRMVIRQLIQIQLPLSVFCFAANAASAVSVLFYLCMNFVKYVSVFAMGFVKIYSRNANTAQNIFLEGNNFNMGRIYTVANSAKMVTMQFFSRNNFHKKLVYKTVCGVSLALNREIAITVMKITLPFPTRRTSVKKSFTNFNLGKNLGKNFAIYGQAIRIIVSHIVSYIDNLARLETRGANSRSGCFYYSTN